jgi:hypothetical protein
MEYGQVSEVSMEGQASKESPRRKRGRPPGSKKRVTPPTQGQEPQQQVSSGPGEGQMSEGEEQESSSAGEEKISPFSSYLRSILRHDRSEIARVARELEVAENTVYRWMNGSSIPRPPHLRRLPDVLSEHRGDVIYAINKSFPGLIDAQTSGILEVRKDIYQRVLDLVYSVEEPDTRFWQVLQVILDAALQHLDGERHGMAVTYATLMPPHPDGIHSLREFLLRGNDPWPHTFESKIFLGSTSLAGTAAVLQRLQIWDSSDEDNRLLVEIDNYERSACATPVLRGGHIAGVLIISSAQQGFFYDTMACRVVDEYAHLLAVSLQDKDFYPYSALSLRPMPRFNWQQTYINESYVARIIAYARRHGVSRSVAETHIRKELELEFEKEGRAQLERQRAQSRIFLDRPSQQGVATSE